MKRQKMTIREALKGTPLLPIEIRGVIQPSDTLPKVEKIEANDTASLKILDDKGDEWQMLNLSELAREASDTATGYVVRIVAKKLKVSPEDIVVLGRSIGILYRMIKAKLDD
jgi:hypothetical protein